SGESGGTGRRTGFRFQRGNPCGFESRLSHYLSKISTEGFEDLVMQVSLTATGGLERRLEVAVPETEVTGEIEQRLKNISRTARLKGFRPGKAPLTVVRKQFGDQVHAEVVQDLMRSSFAQALTQEKLTPAGGPRIEPISMGQGDGLK